jgi:GntR family transcriptional regulator
MAGLVTRGGSVVPKYYQVERALRARIARMHVGDALPSEPELCNEFGVSRTTLRQAMDVLEAEKLLQRLQGRGTFVTGARVEYPLASYGPDDPPRDRAETYRVLSVERRPAPEEAAERLRIDVGTPVLWVRRVAFHDRVPMRLSELLAGPTVEPLLKGVDFGQHLLTETLIARGVPVAGYRIEVEVGTLDEQTADELGLRAGLPTLDVNRVVLNRSGRPLALIHLVTRGDVGRYVLRLPERAASARRNGKPTS